MLPVEHLYVKAFELKIATSVNLLAVEDDEDAAEDEADDSADADADAEDWPCEESVTAFTTIVDASNATIIITAKDNIIKILNLEPIDHISLFVRRRDRQKLKVFHAVFSLP